MPRLERGATAYWADLLKFTEKLAHIDPHDPHSPYHTIYTQLPKAKTDNWWEAVRDVAQVQVRTRNQYSKEVVQAAVRHGLVPKGTTRLEREMYLKLSDLGRVVKSMVHADIERQGIYRGNISGILRRRR